ncbi:MAG: hypothetical protein QOG94_2629 [Solirubrobacteraceae bacterium]|nr:hypothetical protein [Solirubrobacteraceae bacterium]
MTAGVLLLSSDKPEIIERLRAADVGVAVIARERYAGLYDGWPIELVDDLGDVGQVVAAARRHARRRTPDCVVAATEKGIVSAGHVRRDLDLRGQGADEALRFAHKVAMKRALRAAGLPVADFALAANAAELKRAARRLGLPVVVKPALGSGAVGTTRLDDFDALAGAFAADDGASPVPRCVEAFVDVRRELHCDAVVRGGELLLGAVSEDFAPLLLRERRRNGSRLVDQHGADADAVRALTRDSVAALGLRDGVVHLECFDTAGGLVVGELTCRPGGGGVAGTLRRGCGVDVWQELLLAELGAASAVDAAQPAQGGAVHGWTWAPGRAAELAHLLDDPCVVGVWPSDLGDEVAVLDLVAPDDAAMLAAQRRLTRRPAASKA